MTVLSCFSSLNAIRETAGPASTRGLNDDLVAQFVACDPRLARAIEMAASNREAMQPTHGELFRLAEEELCRRLQEHILNFYPASSINPYVPLAALGPWIVTTHGAVVHDSGGYGMLGMGHAPATVVAAMSEPWVMANVMTAGRRPSPSPAGSPTSTRV